MKVTAGYIYQCVSNPNVFYNLPFINDLCFPSCCCSGTKSCLTPGNTINRSTPYIPILHYLPEFAQTYGQWYHPTISSSVTHFSICLQSFPASGSFLMSWLFPLGDQIIGASVSAAVLPMDIQGWFPLGLTGLMPLQSKGFSRVFSKTTAQKHQLFGT